MDEVDRVMAILEGGGVDALEAASREVRGFPDGVDALLGRRWIINAIDCGSKESVLWMLGRGVELDFVDEEGRSPLLCALERESADKYEILESLLNAGAPINRRGANGWTPAHMAAANDDVNALRVLVRHGADLSIRTVIDDNLTPLGEAEMLGKLDAAKYLESVSGRMT